MTRYRTIRGRGGAVVAGHPLAAAAGARILERGGNAVDAAVAAAAVSVVRPHMSGIGGDGFRLVYEAATRRIFAVNAGGPAPAAAGPDRFPGGIPSTGPRVCTVPGIVDGWSRAWERAGRMRWELLFEPAIELAEGGFPMYEALAAWIRHYRGKYDADPECARTLLAQGRPPRAGEALVQRDLARSLRLLARHGARELYEGELAAAYTRYMETASGLTTAADLKSYHAQVAEPVSGEYRGHVSSRSCPCRRDGCCCRCSGPWRRPTSALSTRAPSWPPRCVRCGARSRTASAASAIRASSTSRWRRCCRAARTPPAIPPRCRSWTPTATRCR